MAIINQLLDISWICWHILPNLLSSGTAKTAAQTLMRNRAAMATGTVVHQMYQFQPRCTTIWDLVRSAQKVLQESNYSSLKYQRVKKSKKIQKIHILVQICIHKTPSHGQKNPKKPPIQWHNTHKMWVNNKVNNKEELVSFIYIFAYFLCVYWLEL